MTRLALIRHAPTDWNLTGRLQGRRDPPLRAGIETEWRWRAPRELDGFRWLSSPLCRAVQTAHLLGIAAPVLTDRLAEMSWGEWEGRTLDELRNAMGDGFADLEAAGLDFRPPGGESPRDVQARVMPLLEEIASAQQPTAAVTHKGVIRAILALATGWDMLAKPPYRLRWSATHVFVLDSGGHPSVERLNLPLEEG